MKKVNWGLISTIAGVVVTAGTLLANIASQKQLDNEINEKIAEAVANLNKGN